MTLARVLREQRISGDARRGRSVTVNVAESPLSWLFSRRLVTPRQYQAGEALRRDYERAALGPSVTMRWDASGVKASRVPGVPDRTIAQSGAKSRFDGAMAAAGPGLWDILWRTICAGEGLPDAERALAWPARSGRLVLTLALERVADFYRIADTA